DDFDRIYNIRENGVFGVWTTAPEIFFRPIISVTLFIDYSLWKLNPLGYHLTNVIFHSICSFLVYIVTISLLERTWRYQKNIKLIAVIASCTFLVLHSHVEAVAWISARADLVFTGFCLAAFWVYLRYKRYSKLSDLIISYLLFLCGTFSKESALIFPGFIFAYELYDVFNSLNKQHSFFTFFKTVFLPIFYSTAWLIYFPLRYLGLGKLLGGYGGDVHLNYNWFTILQGFYSSLRVIIPPLTLSTPLLWGILFILFLFSLIGFLYHTYKQGKATQETGKLTLFLLGCWSISILPFLNIGVSTADTQSERFLYLSSAFFSIFLTLVLEFIFTKRQFVLILLVTSFSMLSINQIYLSSQTWITASQISQQTITSVKSLKENQGMFVINLPDNYKGAYIFRNGFYQALLLFCPFVDLDWIIVASFHTLLNPQDEVEVTGITSHEYRATMQNPDTYFVKIPELLEKNVENNGFEMTSLDYENYRSYTLKIIDTVRLHRIFYYTNQKLKRVLT
ncbi:MAG: hypothetical protein SWJ54_22665, partial [Cyanobacteriota bacterium]|nr:hypothetical protein [Cyanobacteriota bacterium]